MSGRILVTGAGGFVGRHLVADLVREGRDLTLAVRHAGACPVGWRTEPRIRIVETGNLEDGIAREALTDVTQVVHLAGLAHVAKSDRSRADDMFMRANARSTERLATASARAGVERFIHLSSLAAVVPNAVSFTIDDQTDCGASTAYGRSKREAEGQVRELAATGAMAISLRPPLIVGFDAKGNWAGLQALAASRLPLPLSGLKNERSFVGIGTLTEALAALCRGALSPASSGEYCVADRQTISTSEILRELRTAMGIPHRLFYVPPSAFAMLGGLTGRRRQLAGLTGSLVVDASRFFDRFGVTPSLDLREAIRQSGAAYAAARRASSGSPARSA